VDEGGVGLERRDDLDEGHDRCGIEEMQTHDALGMGTAPCDRRNGKRRRVRRENSIRGEQSLKGLKERGFRVRTFHDGLDDEHRPFHRVELRRPGAPREGLLGHFCCAFAPSHQALERLRQSRFCAFERGFRCIDNDHVVAGFGGDLGDSRAHRACADHGNPGGAGK
jgi:hypothetical protein